MNMHARFGFGLGAGLLLGVLIIGSTSFYSASQSNSAPPNLAPRGPEAQFGVSVNESVAVPQSAPSSLSSSTVSQITTSSIPSVTPGGAVTTFTSSASSTGTGWAGANATSSVADVGASANLTAGLVTGLNGTAAGASGMPSYAVIHHSYGYEQKAVLASQVQSIGRQPLITSLAAFMPVVAAALFGAILYRVSKTREGEDGSLAPG